MACKELPVGDQSGLQGEKLSLHRSVSCGSLLSEVSATSGYSSLASEDKELLCGSVKPRRSSRRVESQYNAGKETSLATEVLTEQDATEISSKIGRDWQLLGRNLQFSQAALDNISDDKSNHTNEDKAHCLLIKFIRQHGSAATKKKLADALFKIGRRDIAEDLIGKEHFASKSPDKPILFLREEGRFSVPDEDGKDISYFTCRSIDDGKLYLVRKLEGNGFEESCKTLKQQDTIADSILKSLDVNGIVKAEKQKKDLQKFKEAQEKIVGLLNGLQEIANSLQSQERKEKRIQVWKQLLEDEQLLTEMQRLVTNLLLLTSKVSHLEDPFPLEAQMYSFCLGLSASLRDLEERVKMLREMAPRGKKMIDQIESEKFDQVLKKSRSLEKEIKMKEKYFIKRCKEYTVESQKRPRHGENCASSEPPLRGNRYSLHVPEVRRGSSQPVSENDLRKLREEVAPPSNQEEGNDLMEEGSSVC